MLVTLVFLGFQLYHSNLYSVITLPSPLLSVISLFLLLIKMFVLTFMDHHIMQENLPISRSSA